MGLGIWLIILPSAVLLLAGIMPIIPLSAEALTTSDIDDTKNSITQLQEKLDSVEESITTKKELIESLYQERDSLYESWEWYDSQKLQSWDALERVGPTKTQLDNIEKTITSESKQLGTLYATKSDYTIQLSELQSTLEDQKYLISLVRDRSPFDVSKIPKHIGVQLSQTCIDMIKNNINHICPTYEELYSLDTSNHSISGSFGYDESGYFSRAEPPYKNSWRLYDFDNTPRIFVDPPQGMGDKIKIIIIESRLPEYFTTQDMKLDNGIRTWYESRYVDNCSTATISGEQWNTLLPDTIFLFNNGCTSSNFDEFNFEKMSFTILPLDQTQYWKDKVWLEQSKERCKELCFEY